MADDANSDLPTRLQAALTPGCRLWLARDLVRWKYARGGYPALAWLDDEVCEALARQLAGEKE